jgi:hypothetical protein
MMDISGAFGGKPPDHSRMITAQKSEKALAIKQGWQQAFNLLDINLDHGEPNYSFNQNSEPAKELLNYQPFNPSTLVGEVAILVKEPVSGELNNTHAKTGNVNRVTGNHPAILNILDVGIEQPISTVPMASLTNPFFFSTDVGMARKIVSSSDSPNVLKDVLLTKKSEHLLIGSISNYREGVAKDVSQKVLGSSSMTTVLAVKQDAEIAQPSHVSLAKVEGGFMILARDYRTNEKIFTKKLVDSLKAILLAGGALKKILMNGKSIS